MSSTSTRPAAVRQPLATLRSQLPPQGAIVQLSVLGSGRDVLLAADSTAWCLIRHSNGILNIQGIAFKNDGDVFVESTSDKLTLTLQTTKRYKALPFQELSWRPFFLTLRTAITRRTASIVVKVIQEGPRTILVDEEGSAVQLTVFGQNRLQEGVV